MNINDLHAISFDVFAINNHCGFINAWVLSTESFKGEDYISPRLVIHQGHLREARAETSIDSWVPGSNWFWATSAGGPKATTDRIPA